MSNPAYSGEITVPLCESFAAIGIDISEEQLRKFEGALFARGLNVAWRTPNLRHAVETVVSTFEKDEMQGFRSKDRQFAIEILKHALTTP